MHPHRGRSSRRGALPARLDAAVSQGISSAECHTPGLSRDEPRGMTRITHRARWAAEIVLVVAVFAAGLLVFFTARAKIDSDEGNWIGTTRYFETLFVEH